MSFGFESSAQEFIRQSCVLVNQFLVLDEPLKNLWLAFCLDYPFLGTSFVGFQIQPWCQTLPTCATECQYQAHELALRTSDGGIV